MLSSTLLRSDPASDPVSFGHLLRHRRSRSIFRKDFACYMHVWPDSTTVGSFTSCPQFHTQHYAMRSNESPLYLIWEKDNPHPSRCRHMHITHPILCLHFSVWYLSVGNISNSKKKKNTLSHHHKHINMSTGGLSNSCTKTYHWRRLLSIIPLYRVAPFSFVYHGLGVHVTFTFPCFFFPLFFFLFILLSHLICCGHVFVSRSVARYLFCQWVADEHLHNDGMEWNEIFKSFLNTFFCSIVIYTI